MQTDRPSTRAQRLGLVFKSAGAFFAVPAAAVVEVAPAPRAIPASHGQLPIEDLSSILGGSPSRLGARSVVLVLDSQPPRALLVEEVEEVSDLAAAPFFGLPGGFEASIRVIVRGALLHRDRLVLEIDAQGLAALRDRLAPARPLQLGQSAPVLAQPPAKALVFEVGEAAGGAAIGVPLPLVTGVVQLGAATAVPLVAPGCRGVAHHERSLIPLWDLSVLTGGPATGGNLAVVLDAGGAAIGLAARTVVGVMDGFATEPGALEGAVRHRARDGREVVFPEFERWFAPAA